MKFIDRSRDTWRAVGGDDGPMVTITPAADRLLTLLQWYSIRKQWPQGLQVGVSVPNDADVEALADDLPRISLVALEFPKWTDGRAYSQARLLRSRLRFTGAVRATGEVLVDMVLLMARTGFDEAVLRADQSVDAAERALSFFLGHYQGDVRERQPLFALPPGAADVLARESTREFVNPGAAI